MSKNDLSRVNGLIATRQSCHKSTFTFRFASIAWLLPVNETLLFFSRPTDHHVPGVRHERGKRLWFDVSEVPPGEHIISAELRLYRSMDVKNRRNRGSYMITAYRVLKTEDGWVFEAWKRLVCMWGDLLALTGIIRFLRGLQQGIS